MPFRFRIQNVRTLHQTGMFYIFGFTHLRLLLGCPASPVIKWVFGRRCHKVDIRGRENTRVWYVETMFSQMVSYDFLLHEPLDTFCTLSALPLKNPQSVANLKNAICVVRSDSIMGVTL